MKSDKTRAGTQREGMWLRLARAPVTVPELPGPVVRGGV